MPFFLLWPPCSSAVLHRSEYGPPVSLPLPRENTLSWRVMSLGRSLSYVAFIVLKRNIFIIYWEFYLEGLWILIKAFLAPLERSHNLFTFTRLVWYIIGHFVPVITFLNPKDIILFYQGVWFYNNIWSLWSSCNVFDRTFLPFPHSSQVHLSTFTSLSF